MISTEATGDMTRPASRRLYLVVAYCVAAITSGYAVWCVAHRLAPGDGLFRMHFLVTGVLLLSWLINDPDIPSIKKPSFDCFLLVWISFPFLAVYFMYCAHGSRGILRVVGMLGIMLAPALIFFIAMIAPHFKP